MTKLVGKLVPETVSSTCTRHEPTNEYVSEFAVLTVTVASVPCVVLRSQFGDVPVFLR